MADCCGDDSKNSRDLTASPAAWLFWYAPIFGIIAALFLPAGRNWLWAAALAVMGIGCVANAARCKRLHCYFTGPLYLMAAGYSVAAQLQLVPLKPGLFLLVILVLSFVFQCAEKPFGRYRIQV